MKKKEENEHHTYLKPHPQHTLLVVSVLPEKCCDYTLELFVLSQECGYSTHSASLPPDVCSQFEYTPLFHSLPAYSQQVAGPLSPPGNLVSKSVSPAVVGLLCGFLIRQIDHIGSEEILCGHFCAELFSMYVNIWL